MGYILFKENYLKGIFEIGLIICLVSGLFVSPTFAFLSGWDYRQGINVSNTAGDLTNYQVKIELNSSNVGANFDWSDNSSIRFTNSTDDILDYWIEDWDSTGDISTIWVNVTSLTNNANTTIYMYYGNPSASSESNGNNTFEFFDDFEGSSFDAKWTSVNSYWSVSGGNAVHSLSSSTWDQLASANQVINGIMTSKIKISNDGDHQELGMFLRSDGTYADSDVIQYISRPDKPDFANIDYGTEYDCSNPIGVDTWHYLKMSFNGSNITTSYSTDDTSFTGCYSYTTTHTTEDDIGFRGIMATAYVDWVRVRKYASPEPTYTIGSEETSGDTTPPSVSIIYPTAITYSENVNELNYTASDTNPGYCWYSTDGGITNSSAVEMGTNFTGITSVGGSNTWTVYCNDTSNNINSDSITFTLNALWSNIGYPYANKSFRNTEFVGVDGANFTLGGQQYRLQGADSYYLTDYGTNHTYDDDGNEINNSREAVLEILNEAQYLNINVIRTWASSQGSNDSHWIINESGGHFNLFEVGEPGNYSEDMFKSLDWVIYEASKRNIRLQLVLVNNWNDYGGMRWYAQMSPTTNKTYENEDDDGNINWWKFHDQFYTDENCRQYYRNYINHTLNRNNTITGILYKDDPTIFAWLLANEPRAKTDSTSEGGDGSLIVNWTKNMTAYIKSIDSNHLVGLGIEGFGDPWSGTSMIGDHNGTGVDFATFELHPEQWDWFAQRSEGSDDLDWIDGGITDNATIDWWTIGTGYSYNNRYEGSYIPYYDPALSRHGYDNWIKQNVEWGNSLGLPVLLQEVAMPTSSPSNQKDRFYKQAINSFYSNGGDGLMFWNLNHDNYYYSTDPDGEMDDGYSFYLSDDEILKNKSQSVIDAFNFTLYNNSGGSWVDLLNSYKYNFIVNIGFASDTVIDNCTLFLNISNGTEWTNYYADQSNTSEIINSKDYIFEKQFNNNDREFYWYSECYGDGTTITSDAEYLEIQTGVPVVTLHSPKNSGFSNNNTTEFIYDVTETDGGLDISSCELYIDGVLNKTDSTVTKAINQSFSSFLSDGNYNWYVKCTDIGDNIGVSETRSLTVDTTPTTTTASAVKSDGSSYAFDTWTNLEYVNVTLSCSDGSGSGCNTTQYCTDTDNSCIPNLIYSTPIQISTEGTSYIRYRSNDTAGNLETTKDQTIKIDTTLPNCTLISQTPSNINSSSAGSITILYNCTDTNGINDSKIAIATTVNHTTNGNLNFSWRFPSNTMAGGEYNEQRAEHRGKGDWFESLFPNVWEWSVHDNDCGHISIVDSGSNWKTYNITKSDIHGLFHQYIPIDKKTLETTGIDKLGFYKNNPIITEIHYRNIDANSVMQLVFYINGTNSNKYSSVYYCNETKKNDGLSIEDSTNCVYLGSIGTTDSYEYTKDNVSYYKMGFYIDGNETIGNVKVSEISYFAFVTSATNVKAWNMGYSDDTNLIGNISMNNSKMLFASSDDGISFTQHNGTGVAWLSEVHNNIDIITYKMYSCDNFSNCGWNEVTTDEIGVIQYAPDKPQITYIDGDTNKNGSYTGIINIGCLLGEDANGDTVAGNLSLRNTDGTWNYIVNESFSDSGLEINVSFNTSLVNDGIYKLNLTNCDNTSKCSSILIDTNFTIDNTNPSIEYNPTTTPAGTHSQDWIFINITANDTNKENVTFEWNGVNETFDNSNGNVYWENKTGLTDGNYTIKAYINDSVGNINSTDLRSIILSTTSPPIQYGSTSLSATGSIINFCGNGICETDENNIKDAKYCPEDCKEKMVVKRDQIAIIIVVIMLFVILLTF